MSDFQTSDKFEKKYAIWKNSLLDMTKANKQLYFKIKSKTLEIIHPSMQEFFKVLVVKERKMEFPPVFEPSLIKKDVNESDEEFQLRLKLMHQNRIKEKIEKNSNSRELVTKLSDKLLEKQLKNLRRRAKSSLSEQGINILYVTFGLMKWIDIENRRKETIFSPIYFVPIKITRKRVLDYFHIEILDDEVLLNPSLDEKFRSEFRTELPKFPENFNEDTLLESLNKIKEIIKNTKDWDIMSRSFIGLFSFAKINMYNDLVEHKFEFYNHPIIHALGEGGGYEENPANIPAADSYKDVADPMNSYHILDSDSSQMKAITYAKAGSSLVIKGPPGTGKSQAITNIIAECLSAGKKVLFVAEKRAALEVVKRRLDKCGVGEFCLELHSHKSNKKDILREIEQSLKTELVPRHFKNSKYKKLYADRLRLNTYIKRIHEQIESTNSSLYEKIDEYEKMRDIPLVSDSAGEIRRPFEYTEKTLFEIEDLLGGLDSYKDLIRDYDLNEWAEIEFPYYDLDLKDNLYDALRDMKENSLEISRIVNSIEQEFNVKPINSMKKIQIWNEFYMDYYYNALEFNPDEFLKHQGFIKNFLGSYRKIKNQLVSVLKNPKSEAAKDLFSQAQRIKQFQEKLLNFPKVSSYQGIDDLMDKLFLRTEKINNYQSILTPIFEYEGISLFSEPPAFTESNLSIWRKYAEICTEWLNKYPEFEKWLPLQIALQELKQYRIDEFVLNLRKEPIMDLDVSLYSIFYKAYLYSWIKNGLSMFKELALFNPEHHKKIRNDFINLDEECIKLNRYRLAKKLFDERPKHFWMQTGIKSSEYSILLREMAKQRNIKPLRSILSLTKNFILKFKPCFLMSPLSVSQYLPLEVFNQFFDVVIFDEASQITPEDAIGAIMRGKQLIVVGDEKQLPPTSFFSSNLYDSMDSTFSQVDIFDSILEECTGIGLPVIMLSYHYRSRKEGLIVFSNYHFYENGLISFPDPLREAKQDATDMEDLAAIEFNYLPDAVYDKGKSRKNRQEARVVAEHIIEHYRNNEKNNTHFSLGVIAFSEAQQTAIMDALEKLYRSDPELENLVLKYSDEEPLFIKNLESVQGDERDVIYFSIGYGKDKDGQMTLNFGPLNKDGGHRRLNVAITRARYHVKLFCSFLPGEINLERSKSKTLKLLVEYLEYARTGRFTDFSTDKVLSKQLQESNLLKSLKSELEKMGYQVDENIGRSKFQIDLAVVDPDDPTKYIMAIETDGGSYARASNARDRERTRNIMLRSLGWGVYHIWTPEWFNDRKSVLKQIKKELEKLRKEKKRIIKEVKEETPDVELVSTDYNPEKEPAEINGVEHLEAASIKGPTSIEAYFSLPGVVEYKTFTPEKSLTPEQFNSKTERKKAINKIIKTEGPIHEELLIRRIKEYFNIKRFTKQQKIFLEETLKGFNEEDDFYYPSKCQDNLIRIERVKNQDPRKFIWISDMELKNALVVITKKAMSIDKDELFKKVLQMFGFSGRRPEYIPLLEQLLKELMDEGRLSMDEVRNFEYTPSPIKTIKTGVSTTDEAVANANEISGSGTSGTEVESGAANSTAVSSSDTPLEPIDIDEIFNDMEFDSIKTEPQLITAEDVLDVLSNGLDYTLDELIDELDLESDEEIRYLTQALRELLEKGKILADESGNEVFYKIVN